MNMTLRKFYQFFTKKYLLTDRTIHIVGIYNHQHCNKINNLLDKIRNKKKPCLTISEKLVKKMEIDDAKDLICDLSLKYKMGLLEPIYDVLLLEFCDNEFAKVIEWYMNKIKKSKSKKGTIDYFIGILQRILFQIIFTLAIIKEDYPGFLHNDLFTRNILISTENGYLDNEFLAYYYKQKIFYLPVNGLYAKINDFGQSIIVNELEPNTFKMEKKFNQYYHINPFDSKSDIFNLLHDIYNGQNLGTISISLWAEILKIPYKEVKPIYNFLNKFININTIDRINKKNNLLLNSIWNIDEIKILENSVKTPNEYLMGNYFTIYQKLPDNGKIIKHINIIARNG